MTWEKMQDLLQEMVNEIPKDEVKLLQALEVKKKMIETTVFTRLHMGLAIIQTLQDHIPCPRLEWHFKTISIFSGVEVERLREISLGYDDKGNEIL